MIDLSHMIGKGWAMPCDPPETFDCYELVRHVRRSFGLNTPSVVDRADRVMRDADQFGHPPARWSELPRPVLGCVARIGTKHVGVYLGASRIVHCIKGSGVRIDQAFTLTKLMGAVTYWEFDDVQS